MQKLMLELKQFIRYSCLLEALTNRLKMEIKTRFSIPTEDPQRLQNNRNLPKTEEEFNAQLAHLETLVPDKNSPNQYIIFLANTAYSEPASWIINEDEAGRIIPLLKRAREAKIQDVAQFKTTQALDQEISQRENNKESEKSAAAALQPSELDEVRQGASVIFTEGIWTIWKVPKGNTEANARAAYLLASNKRHGTKWCVGYDNGNPVRTYLKEGDFFVIQKNNISTYAISTNTQNYISIWNRVDSRIFYGASSNQNRGGISGFTELRKLVPDLLEKLSYLPNELRPILLAAKPAIPTLEQIPEKLLVSFDVSQEQQIYQTIHKVPANVLIAECSKASDSQDQNNITIANSVFSYMCNPTYGRPLSLDELELFTVNGFLNYLEAHCNNNNRIMPKHIEQFILAHL